MKSQLYRRAGAVALAIAGSLAGVPAASPPAAAPASQGAAVPAGAIKIDTAIRTHYDNGDPLGDFFTALSVRYGVVVLQPEGLEVYVLRSFDLPATVGDALTIARQTLEPQGYSLVQKVSDGRLIVRIVKTAEAKKIMLSESPLSFGTQGEAIDISDPTRLVTHVFPIAHADLAANLRRDAMEDPDVSAEVTGGGDVGANLILTGPALKVQRAVETLAKLDKPTEGPIVAHTLALQHLNAQTTADALNEVFSHDPAPMKAVADRRTNSIVVTGPEDRVLEVMVGLVSQEAKKGRVLPPPGGAVPIPAGPAGAGDGDGCAGYGAVRRPRGEPDDDAGGHFRDVARPAGAGALRHVRGWCGNRPTPGLLRQARGRLGRGLGMRSSRAGRNRRRR